MFKFDFLEKGLGLVFPPHFVYDFSGRMFLMLYFANWLHFIAWLPLILEILGNICMAILCFPGLDVTNFEINLIFLIKPFFYMPKGQGFKYELKTGICISPPTALCLVPGPGPGPQLRPPALAHNLYLPSLAPNLCLPALAPNLCLLALAPNLYLPALAPNLYLMALTPNFYLPALVSPEPGLAYTNLVPPICIYWPWPTIFITVLWFCIYLLIYSSSSGSSNISNSSNFLGLDNTHISMPILVN